MCFIAFVISYVFVKEEKISTKQITPSFREVWKCLPNPKVSVCLFITTLVMQLALMSIQPIITVYITQLSSDSTHIALISGAVFAASGLASIIAAPKLGEISDKIGAQKILLAALIVAGILFIPQAFVENSLQLGILRFLLGLATAGLLPSINSLVRRSTCDSITGQAFGYNQSAQFLGMFLGSILGGQMAGTFGIQSVFLFTGGLLLINAFWVYHTIFKEKLVTR